MDVQHSYSGANISLQNQYRSAWRLSIALAVIGVVTLVGLFWTTVASAIELWWGQPTYNYAFLILPISAYLVWRKRDEVSTELPSGSLWGVAAVGAFGLFWLASDLAEINEGRHIAFVGMMLGILLASLGWRIFKILSFPFLYLWLLVPTRHCLPSAAAADCDNHLRRDPALAWDPCLRGRLLYRSTFGPLPYRARLRRPELHPCSRGASAALRLFVLSFLLETANGGAARSCPCNYHERCTDSGHYRPRPLGRTTTQYC